MVRIVHTFLSHAVLKGPLHLSTGMMNSLLNYVKTETKISKSFSFMVRIVHTFLSHAVLNYQG